MGSITTKIAKDGKPRYYARYKLPDGRWKLEGSWPRKKDAEAKLRIRESEVAAGEYGKKRDISFKDLVALFLEDYVRIKLKPRTIDDYTQVCRDHLIPYFGKRMIATINRGDIQHFIKEQLSNGYSPRTVNKMVTILGKIFAQAIKWEFVRENPARNLDKPRQPRKEMEYLEPEEAKRLMDACELNFLPHIATAVFTGMRKGERVALLWGDIDFERNFIRIRRSYSDGYLTDTKSFSSNRTVIMSPMLSGILMEHKANTGGNPNMLVFLGEDGDYVKPYIFNKTLNETLARAGLKHIRWHDLRHTYAALMIAMGENIKYIQCSMGHASITTTLDKYGHLLPQASAGVGERLDKMIFEDEIEASLSLDAESLISNKYGE